jgi:hypothetical protein
MWAPVLQPDKACLDRDTCSVVASVNAELAKPGVKRGGNPRTGVETHEAREGREAREAREGREGREGAEGQGGREGQEAAARGGRKGWDVVSLRGASKPAGRAEKRAVLKEQPVQGPTAMG